MHKDNIKNRFPIFTTHPDLVYLDAAATSLTPQCVVDAVSSYYTRYDANIARGVYKTSADATTACEISRASVATFLHTQKDNIVFTTGTTNGCNIIAHGITNHIAKDDEIIVTHDAHHANFIPWQNLALQRGARFVVSPLRADGTCDTEKLYRAITRKTKIVALTHISNVLGTITPVAEIIAHIRTINPNVIIVVDAAQSVGHMPVDVERMDCDFLVFSLHKIFGPTGVGVLYGKKQHLENLAPFLTGGEMIARVTSAHTTYADSPHHLEAGTPNIAGIIAVNQTLRFLQDIGHKTIRAHEQRLVTYCMKQMRAHFGDNITIIGPDDSAVRSNIISFTFKNYHPHDIATICDDKNHIALRAGQHCTMPLHHEVLHTPATARVSFSLYNTTQDIDALIDGLHAVENILHA